MICSAPRRLAAITPQSPTRRRRRPRPSCPAPTRAASAAWWPVPITSESVSSDGISASSSPTGSTTSVPSACGTRTASPCAAVDAVSAPEAAVDARGLQPFVAEDAGAVGVRERRDDDIARLHRADIGAGVLDDADELVAHRPARVARAPSGLYGHRSLPQMQARVTRTSASVGSTIRGVGNVSTRTSPAPYMTVARMCLLRSSSLRATEAHAPGHGRPVLIDHSRTAIPDEERSMQITRNSLDTARGRATGSPARSSSTPSRRRRARRG